MPTRRGMLPECGCRGTASRSYRFAATCVVELKKLWLESVAVMIFN